MYYSTTHATPIGEVTLAADDTSLVGLWIDGQKYHGAAILDDAVRNDDLALFAATRAWLESYFAGGRPPISEIPLAPRGGDFRQSVWDILCEIPYGEVTTYGAIAARMAAKANKPKMSSQAVGGAVGHNPISIIIPCHRVVGSNGSLTGYASGIWRKVKLLELEGVEMSGLFTPVKGTAL
ncbi:MAG: methylated-DNA--[protein]-cysteine S-methyltransferase [Coriobacteriales bacterium]|jgi:methylated-DNA-[protein]-cysteine S-methyltransferase|nr:methylated-DNA--[protein]-cysteine S-methyltransferase [Coriobacteriales bacterium]